MCLTIINPNSNLGGGNRDKISSSIAYEEKWDDTVQNPPLSKLEKKTWLWLCCRLTLWPQSSTNPLLVLDLIKTKTTPKSINMKLISIYQERSISSSKPCWLRKPPRGTMLINQTNCLTNQSETNLYLLFMLAEFQFHAREYSHFLVFFLSGSCCKNIWHDLFCLPIICRRIFSQYSHLSSLLYALENNEHELMMMIVAKVLVRVLISRGFQDDQWCYREVLLSSPSGSKTSTGH